MVLIDLQYLPSLEFFCRINRENEILLEGHENFTKQTYRNRCYILGANGPLMLNIPIIRGRSNIPIREVQVDDRENWRATHWRSIISAYGNAPFFEYYGHYFKKELEKQGSFLWDINLRLLTLCLKLLEMDVPKISISDSYHKNPSKPLIDLRSVIHPKKSPEGNSFYRPVPYIQVFGKDFVPNLSIIDLLFCQGPDARRILNDSDVS